jgi:hypothetical protein
MKGEALRSTLEHCRDMLDEAVQYASQSYQFGPNAYAYEALMRCTTARDTVARLTAAISDISHYVDALEQRGAAWGTNKRNEGRIGMCAFTTG